MFLCYAILMGNYVRNNIAKKNINTVEFNGIKLEEPPHQ